MPKLTLTNPRAYVGFAALLTAFGASHLLDRTGPLRSPSGEIAKLGFRLTDVTEAAGLKHVHVAAELPAPLSHIAPYISSVGANVAVVDYDNDGWPDVYLPSSAAGARNSLFRNNHDGTFTDLAEKAGIADVNSMMTARAIFFDADNNGFKDLFLLAYCPRLFMNRGDGTFGETTGLSQFQCGDLFGGVNVADLDEDGFLDLVIAPNYHFDPKNGFQTSVMPDNLRGATNGAESRVYRNDGKGRFFPIPQQELPFRHKGWSHAVGVYDIRGTGRTDLWFATDYGTDRVFLNEGGGQFLDASRALVRETLSRSGMNIEFADVDDDGHPLIFVSHIAVPGQIVTGNQLWKWVGGKAFRDLARDRGVHDCGWAWGAKFLDYDNDGKLDLFVGNGFVSASREKDYWYRFSVMEAADRRIVQDAKYWPMMGDSSLAGYQQSCVFLNEGRTFANVTARTGVQGDLSDERGVAVIDYLNNGSQGLVISNQKQPAKLYRNDQISAHHWIGFKLVGTRSNRDAFGAKVRLNLAGRTIERQLQPLNGYAAQSDDRLHFGLGGETRILSATIEWPSHLKQELDVNTLKLDAYQTLQEPAR